MFKSLVWLDLAKDPWRKQESNPVSPQPSPVFQTLHWPYRAVPSQYWQSDDRTSTAVLPHLRATQKGNLARPHCRSPQAVRKPEGLAIHCHLRRGDWSFHLTNEKKKKPSLLLSRRTPLLLGQQAAEQRKQFGEVSVILWKKKCTPGFVCACMCLFQFHYQTFFLCKLRWILCLCNVTGPAGDLTFLFMFAIFLLIQC